MTTATFLASLGAGSRARARAPWAGLVGLALALTATTAQALAPPVPVCYPHQDGMASYDPADLGDGIVARTEIFYGEDGSYDRRWDVVTHCASGISIAAQLSSNEDVEVVRALVRSAIASPQVFTLEDLTERLDQARGTAIIDGGRPADVETCACQHFYPELRGDKQPF